MHHVQDQVCIYYLNRGYFKRYKYVWVCVHIYIYEIVTQAQRSTNACQIPGHKQMIQTSALEAMNLLEEDLLGDMNRMCIVPWTEQGKMEMREWVQDLRSASLDLPK